MAKSKRESMNKTNLFIGLFVFMTLFITLFVVLYPFPSSKQVSYFYEQNPIIYKQEVFEGEAIQKDGHTYVSVDFFTSQLDGYALFDGKSESLIVTTKDKVVQLPQEQLQLFVNEQPFQVEVPALLFEDGKRYISIDPLMNLYPLKISTNRDSGTIFIRNIGDEVQTAFVKEEQKAKNLRLRQEARTHSPYTAIVEANEKLFVERREGEYSFVRKQSGEAGFIKHDLLTGFETMTVEDEERVAEIEEKKERNAEEPINLVWEAVYSKNPDPKSLPTLHGVNVVSPTWFKVKNEQGEIANLASSEYIDWAKRNGHQVWALFSNNFEPNLTHEVLKNYETRQSMIRQLIQYCEMYHLDGINIDFENVNLEDKSLFTQFVRELTPYLHKQGKVVSVDITFISTSENWSMFYDRKALSKVADYLMVMAYDEHWGSSPKAGSVSSLPWVESNLERLLIEVPNEKLILGMPMYTRLWSEKETDDGKIEVSSKALSMSQVYEWQTERNLEPAFDEQARQRYLEYYDETEKMRYKIWVEDEHSLEQRVALVKKYRLAGVASWSRNFANDAAWQAVAGALES